MSRPAGSSHALHRSDLWIVLVLGIVVALLNRLVPNAEVLDSEPIAAILVGAIAMAAVGLRLLLGRGPVGGIQGVVRRLTIGALLGVLFFNLADTLLVLALHELR